MHLEIAHRKKVKIKMGLQGPSGSGKTYSALLLAYGICNDWSKIAVIDTENHSAALYSHLGEYRVINISDPFTPEIYIEAISICEKSGIEAIIIDSTTHCWEYLLDYHSSLQGNSFTNWHKVTPRHNDFVQKILQSPCHIISTIRTKQDYVLTEKNGKVVPEKVGLKSIQRDGLDYEFSLVFDLDMKNCATTSKDRTGVFFGKPAEKISIETGRLIMDWCNTGGDTTADDVTVRINDCRSIQQLLQVYKTFPQFKEILLTEYETKKRQLLLNPEGTTLLSN